MDKRIFNSRDFLNQPGFHNNSSLCTSVTKSNHGERYYGTYTMNDCSKTISLSIDIGDEEDLNNTLYKLEKIIVGTTKLKNKLLSLKDNIIKGELDRKNKS